LHNSTTGNCYLSQTDTNEWRMHLPACVYTKDQYFEYLLTTVAQQDSWINCQSQKKLHDGAMCSWSTSLNSTA